MWGAAGPRWADLCCATGEEEGREGEDWEGEDWEGEDGEGDGDERILRSMIGSEENEVVMVKIELAVNTNVTQLS